MNRHEFSDPQAVWSNYQRMQARLTRRFNRELAQKTGLSRSSFAILLALIESPDESVRALTLRCSLEWEKSRLSHQLQRMEARGLVTCEECSEDNRGLVVRITAPGRKLATEARLYYEQAVRRYITDVLTADQLKALNTITDIILSRLKEP